MKKAVCISIFNHYDNRVLFAEEFLRDMGFEVTYISSDFDHYTKKYYEIKRENAIQVPSREYKKNLSAQRLLSHYLSAEKTYKVLEELQPDLIYTLVPPNSISRVTARYRRAHKSSLLIMDIFDVWPETFPSLAGKIALRPMFALWRAFRDMGLPSADYIITECGLFRKTLERQLSGRNSKILHLCKKSSGYSPVTTVSTTEFNLCYLGAINNIIDIPAIETLLRELAKLKPVVLHIIGGGESTDRLRALDSIPNISTVYYGLIYDEAEKHKVFDKCSFGLNVMKKTVCIGLTMKSVDYFEAGLPLINTIVSDTAWIVDRYGAGFNIGDDFAATAERIARCDEYMLLSMRYNTRKAFDELFSQEIYNERFKMICDELNISTNTNE